jgi:Cu/Ag efflux pump CusA
VPITHRSRQLVAERIAQATPQLPPGTDAPLLSSLTGRLNEILEFTLESETGKADLMALRDLAEFEIRNRCWRCPGWQRWNGWAAISGHTRCCSTRIAWSRVV